MPMLDMYRPLFAVCCAAAVFLASPQAQAADETKPMNPTISITSTGTVTAKPDQVAITVGVSSTAKTAKAALAANTASMQPVIAALKAAGIEPRDIQTSNFNLQPAYQYFQDGKPPKLTGYQVSNTVDIRLRNIEKLGEILDKVVGEGSNQIAGIQFIVSKADQLRDDARKAAVANATRIAKTYAEAAGVQLGRVLTISEPFADSGVQGRNTMMVQKTSAESAAPIEAGEQTLAAVVTMVWALK
jgi:uncharacterized protein